MRFIGNSDLTGQLNGRNPPLVLRDEIERQEPLAQADMAMAQNSPSRGGGLMGAVSTLVQTVG